MKAFPLKSILNSIKKIEVSLPILWTLLCLLSVNISHNDIDEFFPLFSWKLFSDYPGPKELSYVFTETKELNFNDRYQIKLNRQERKVLWRLGNKIARSNSSLEKQNIALNICSIFKFEHDFQIETVLHEPIYLYRENKIMKSIRSSFYECKR